MEENKKVNNEEIETKEKKTIKEKIASGWAKYGKKITLLASAGAAIAAAMVVNKRRNSAAGDDSEEDVETEESCEDTTDSPVEE